MMRKVLFLALGISLLSLGVAADPVCQDGDDLAWLLAASETESPFLAATCTEGSKMSEVVGCCELGDGRSLRDRYLCVGGEWVYQETTCGPPFTCPRFP